MTLREKLIVLRDKAGISQMSLAHQLDVSRQAVSRWESGDTTPSMDKLKALAKIYGVSLDWLCSDSDMADEKPIEVVSPLEENETKNTTVSAKDKRKRKIRFVAIALVVGVITLTCIWIATRSENIPKLLQLRKEGCSMESGNEAAPARFLRDWSCASSHTPARPA